MAEISTKPYLMRAIYEWCVDSGLTPYMLVDVNEQTNVPRSYVKNGQIVLNVSPTACRDLNLANDWVTFSARFNGVAQQLDVPVEQVAGIFAQETGEGLMFATGPEAAVEAGEAPAGEAVDGENGQGPDNEPPSGPRGKPKLQIVK